MAYSIHDPSVGYCQAQGPLAAVLLTLMPAEQAFWSFLVICEKYLPGYYNMGLVGDDNGCDDDDDDDDVSYVEIVKHVQQINCFVKQVIWT